MQRARFIPQLVLLATLTTACEQCAPGRVSRGVGRLTIRNMGAIADLVNTDARCGFANAEIDAHPAITGEPGRPSTATWTVENCELDLTAMPKTTTDCNEVATMASGHLVVSAKKIITGTGTGDPARPVAPNSPRAVTLEITKAEFDNFLVKSTDSDASLTMITGVISGKVKPLLAKSAELGVCEIPTKNAAFEDVAYDNSLVHVETADHSFDVPIPHSLLSAVNGKIEDRENALWGTITVWDSDEQLPNDDEDSGLNPDYNAEKLAASYACTANLAQPTSYECGDIVGAKLAQGAARLTVRNFGSILELINNDTTCGFASMLAASTAEITGTTGGEGSATMTVTNCLLDLDATPYTTTDCNGVTTAVTGKVRVSGKRTVMGTLSGDPNQPAIPGGPDAVTVEIAKAEFENFKVTSSNSEAALTQISGSISGKAQPRLAVSAELGVCKVPTKNVLFSELSYSASTLHLKNGADEYDFDAGGSNLTAVNGTHGDKQNYLAGAITVAGTEQAIPIDGETNALDPMYDAATFDTAYLCTADLAQPLSYDCSAAIEPRLAQGAARLTVRSFGAVVDRLDKNTTCGFKSRAVLDNATTQGNVGGLGSVTFTVENCTLDFAPDTVVKESCTGSQRKMSGRVTVSGTKTLNGRLTGNADTPVVPMSDAPALVELREIRFDNLKVEEKGTALTWISGAMRGTLHPRVAADSAQHGACGFETPIARFEDLAYTAESTVILRSLSGSFQSTIQASRLTALNGTWGSDSNLLDGTITFSGTEYTLPTDMRDDGLDPEFNQTTFDAEWQCGSVEMPIRFDCTFERPLAQGAAQLGVLTIGTLADALEHDTRCGFSSTAVKNAVTIDGNLGDDGGSAVFSVTQPCELSFTAPMTAVKTDCNNKATYVHGRALVTGTKTLRGYVSGDDDEPIVPTSRDPAEIQLSATFTDFHVWTVPGTNGLTIKGGGISGTVKPRVAIDTTTGACSIPTPVAQLSDIRYSNANLRIESEGKLFDVTVSGSDLDAVNGDRDGVSNRLTGTLTLDGTNFQIPAEGQPVLDPNYDAATFERSYSCTQNIRIPANEAACNMREVLGNGAARLLMLTLGNVSKMTNEDEDCGFSTQSVLTHPSTVVGDVGDYGMMSWDIGGCYLSRSGNSVFKEDCLGRDTYVRGGYEVYGSRTVTGLRDEVRILIFIRFDSIIPTSRDSVTFGLDTIYPDNLSVYEIDPGQTDPERGLLLRNGEMSATVHPVLGERSSDPGRFDVPTPIAHLTSVTARDLDARVTYKGKRFNIMINTASLEAFNGSWAGMMGMTNMISGSITVDGQAVNVSPNTLDPAYSQADFDARYECTDDLMSLVPPSP